MRRVLAILTLVMVATAPATAQNTSTMTYYLQLNGTPGSPGNLYDTSHAVETGLYVMSGTDVLNWSVRVVVGGSIGFRSPRGAANIVFDLALKDGNGNLVGGGLYDTDGGFGITSGPTGEAGFFSTIMSDAGGPFAQQPAAFTYVFHTNFASPFGRLIDPVSANGPNMSQYAYPATYRYYRLPGADLPVDPATVTAPSGTLIGLRAGYENFNFLDGSPERCGVGLFSPPPIAEGQINMRGLAHGYYALQVTAGSGNTVLPDSVNCDPSGSGQTGEFAVAANTVAGTTITFSYLAEQAPPPVVSGGAVSRMYHGGPVNAYIDRPLFLPTIPTSGNVATESRRSNNPANPWTIAVTFDQPLGPPPAVTATGSNGAPVLGTPTVAGNVLSIPILAWNDVNLITLSLTNVTRAGGSAPNPAPYVIKVIALQGDINGNRSVSVGDVNTISVWTGLPVTTARYTYDINANGLINVNDMNLASTLTGHVVVGTYP